MFRLRSFFASLLASELVGATVYKTRFDGTSWDDERWIITTTDLDQGHYQSRMSLANGYLGINLAALGPFFEVDTPVDGDMIGGWPLFDRRQTFATIAGFYDSQPTTNGTNFAWLLQYGGESVISGVPHWAGLHVAVGADILTASTSSKEISNYESALHIRDGLLTWSYTWTPAGGDAIDVEYSMFVHKLHVNQAAVQLKLTSKTDQKVSVIDLHDGDCALRTDFVGKGYAENSPVIWSAVQPWEVTDVQAYIYSAMVADGTANRTRYTDKAVIGKNSSSIAQAMEISLTAGTTSTITKYVGGASSDAFDDPQSTAKEAMSKGMSAGWTKLFASHCTEWQTIMTNDTVDDYRNPRTGELPNDDNVIELAITAVTNPFHLLQNTVGARAIEAAGNNKKLGVDSIPVGGLGSDAYAGWIFWDAEVWMAPGLVVTFPDAARQIAEYRVQKFAQAQANIKTAYQSSQNKTGKFSSGGAAFPWISGRYGNCTAAGPCFDYEYHLNGDIGLEFYNYYAVTGDSQFFENELFPIYDAVAQLYADLVTLNQTSGQYDLYNATDPDEYANFQTNVGFTMVLMKTHIEQANAFRKQFGMQANSKWAEIASNITIPVNEEAGIILEYAAMNGSIEVKQADVVLVDDFLAYPNPYSLADLDYYAGKQSLNGPGMTYGVFSIVANEVSPSGCSSYTYDLYGSQPYTRGPWFQFSEQLVDNFEANGGTHPAYPFLTGIGGANRVAIFGYLGLRLSLSTLHLDPNLPPQIPHLTYRTFYWQGWPIQAVSTRSHTTLTRLSSSLPNANSDYASKPIPVTQGSLTNATNHSLPPNGTLTLRNRQIGYIETVPGNLAQCNPVSSDDEYATGQFPLSAVDGAISTKWQPLHAHKPATITVNLNHHNFFPVSELKFDWAQSPPVSYTVMFSNHSSGKDAVLVAKDENVKVSNEYVAADAAKIVPYASNTTNVTLETAVWSGKFALLMIKGNQAGGKEGGSVAEFAVVAAEE